MSGLAQSFNPLENRGDGKDLDQVKEVEMDVLDGDISMDSSNVERPLFTTPIQGRFISSSPSADEITNSLQKLVEEFHQATVENLNYSKNQSPLNQDICANPVSHIVDTPQALISSAVKAMDSETFSTPPSVDLQALQTPKTPSPNRIAPRKIQASNSQPSLADSTSTVTLASPLAHTVKPSSVDSLQTPSPVRSIRGILPSSNFKNLSIHVTPPSTLAAAGVPSPSLMTPNSKSLLFAGAFPTPTRVPFHTVDSPSACPAPRMDAVAAFGNSFYSPIRTTFGGVEREGSEGSDGSLSGSSSLDDVFSEGNVDSNNNSGIDEEDLVALKGTNDEENKENVVSRSGNFGSPFSSPQKKSSLTSTGSNSQISTVVFRSSIFTSINGCGNGNSSPERVLRRLQHQSEQQVLGLSPKKGGSRLADELESGQLSMASEGNTVEV